MGKITTNFKKYATFNHFTRKLFVTPSFMWFFLFVHLSPPCWKLKKIIYQLHLNYIWSNFIVPCTFAGYECSVCCFISLAKLFEYFLYKENISTPPTVNNTKHTCLKKLSVAIFSLFSSHATYFLLKFKHLQVITR